MANLKSQGTTIWKFAAAADSPQAYSQIGQVISIAGPDGTTGEIDVTNLSSTAKEFVASLPDSGSVQMELSWDHKTTSTQHAALWTAFAAQVSGLYQIRFSNSPATTITFTAFPNAYSVSAAVDDKVGASLGLRITGAVTIA